MCGGKLKVWGETLTKGWNFRKKTFHVALTFPLPHFPTDTLKFSHPQPSDISLIPSIASWKFSSTLLVHSRQQKCVWKCSESGREEQSTQREKHSSLKGEEKQNFSSLVYHQRAYKRDEWQKNMNNFPIKISHAIFSFKLITRFLFQDLYMELEHYFMREN